MALAILTWSVRVQVTRAARVTWRQISTNKLGPVTDSQMKIPARKAPKNTATDNFFSKQEVVFSAAESVEDRHELQSKLETLESIGCTKDQIQESPEILLLTEREILRRYDRLRRCGFYQINIMMLKLGHFRSNAVLKERAQELQAATRGNDTLGASMANKLQCNTVEWYSAKKKYVYLRHVRDMPYFNAKVDYLFSLGFSIEDIKQNIIVLNKSLGCLRSRVQSVMEANVRENLTLSVLNMSERTFSKWLQFVKAERVALGEFSDRYEVFAHILGVTPEDVKQIPVFSKYSLSRMKALTELLLSKGLKQDDILCHAHILIRSSKCILESIEKMKELGLQEPSIVQMVNIINGRQVSRRQSKRRELSILAELLQTDMKTLEPHRELLNSMLLKGKFALRNSVLYLNSRGFDCSDILACPIILGHDLSVLKSYIESYTDHDDYKTCEIQFLAEKGKLLNWIQYLIEKDINFASQEAIAEDDEVE